MNSIQFNSINIIQWTAVIGAGIWGLSWVLCCCSPSCLQLSLLCIQRRSSSAYVSCNKCLLCLAHCYLSISSIHLTYSPLASTRLFLLNSQLAPPRSLKSSFFPVLMLVYAGILDHVYITKCTEPRLCDWLSSRHLHQQEEQAYESRLHKHIILHLQAHTFSYSASSRNLPERAVRSVAVWADSSFLTAKQLWQWHPIFITSALLACLHTLQAWVTKIK